MLNKIKAEWRDLKASPPGHRFVQCHERHQARDAPWLKPLLFFAAIFSFVIGVVLVFIPGPAILFFLISAGLLACEYHPVAKGFDKVEMWMRKMFGKFQDSRKKRQSRAVTRAGRVEDYDMAVLRVAAEAAAREAQPQPQPTAATPSAPAPSAPVPTAAPVDMSSLQVPGDAAPPPAIDLSSLHARDTSPAAPIDMSKLRVPLADTREIQAQAIAQANVINYQAQHAEKAQQTDGREPHPAAPVDMSNLQVSAAPADMSNLQVAVNPNPTLNPGPIPPLPRHVAPVSSAAPAAPPAPADMRHVQMSLKAPAPRPEMSPAPSPSQPIAAVVAAPQPHFVSTKQGTGPDQPRPIVHAKASHIPSPRTAGTMKIWTAEPTSHPEVFQNVHRVIKQSSNTDGSVVLLAPPAIIGEKKKRSRPSIPGERRATPPPPPRH
jgi:hypothetical protein